MAHTHSARNCCGMSNCCVCVNQDEIGVYECCGEYKGDLKPGQ